MADALRLHRDRVRSGRVRGRDPRRPARHEDRGRREGRDRRAVPELRLHPRQGRAARRPTCCPRSTRPASSASTVGRRDGRLRGGRRSAATKVVKTLTGGVGRALQEEQGRVHRGPRRADRRRQRAVGDRRTSRHRSRDPRDRLGHAPIPGTSSAAASSTPRGVGSNELPERLAVVGAGASGAEIASAFARLGTEVLLFEALDQVLPTEDADISKVAARGFKKQGIKVLTGDSRRGRQGGNDASSSPTAARRTRSTTSCIAAGRGARRRGPRPRRGGRGARRAGPGQGRRRACARPRRGVYAIGDLVPGPALAHKASDEGIIAVEDAAGLQTQPIEYIDIPRATFCTPNVASFGLTEAQARDAGPRRRRSARSSTARSAPAPSTATARAWSRSSATALRRAAGRPHRRRQGDRADPGARQRQARWRAATRRSRASSTATRRSPRPSWRPPARPTAG